MKQDGPETYWSPQMFDGERVLYTKRSVEGLDNGTVIESLRTHERTAVIKGATYAKYLPTGHLMYLKDGTLQAAPFDINRLELTGAGGPGLGSGLPAYGIPDLSVSDHGADDYVERPGTTE